MSKVIHFLAVGSLLMATTLLSYPLLSQAASLSDWAQFNGETIGDRTGSSTASVGDVNGDGYADFVIGAPFDDDDGTNAGAAYLVYGSATVFTDATELSTAAKFTGENSGEKAGYSVAKAGDVDNDGYADFFVGAPYNDNGGSDAGAVYLIYGQSELFTGTQSLLDPTTADNTYTIVRFSGESAGDNVGFSVSGAGDVNDDDFDDFLIGAPYHDNLDSDAGAAYLIYGRSSKYSGARDLGAFLSHRFLGAALSDQVGYSLASAGDLNADGYDDFVIGAPYNDVTDTDAGMVYVIYGQSENFDGYTTLDHLNGSFAGEVANDQAGYSLAGIGDLDADGYDDFVIGAPYNDDDANNAGAVYIIYGEADSFSSSVSLSDTPELKGVADNDNAGTSVADAGDVDADGYADFLVGAPLNSDVAINAGAVYLSLGQATKFTGTHSLAVSFNDGFTGVAVDDQAGYSVSGGGDVNGDGYDDLLASAWGSSNVPTTAGTVYLGYIYIDADGDGVAGSDGIVGDSDCDDADSSIFADITYYEDNDGDGFGSSTSTTIRCSVTVPDGYVTNDDDANDDDADNDGSSSSEDCDDTDSTLSVNQTYYQDSDGDGLGSDVSTTLCSLTAPTGYVTNSSDADDTILNTGVDVDGDGTASTSDCDETDSTVSENQTYYQDLDGDGFGSTTSVSLCKATAPTGYATTNTDCNDADGSVLGAELFYQDADGDTFGNALVSEQACPGSSSTGYVSNATDDDDTTFGDIATVVINEDGTVTVTYINTATQSFDPFANSDSSFFSITVSTNARRVIVTNGKLVKVYRDGIKVASKKVNKIKPAHELVKLKVKQFYSSGDTVALATARSLKGKLIVLRLTSDDQLKKKQHATLALLRQAHVPVKLKLKAAKHRVVVSMDKKSNRVKATYRVTSKGRLKLTS